MTALPILVQCGRGCGAVLEVTRPELEPLPQVPDPDKRSPYPNPHERRMFEAVGRAVCEALLAHALYDCPAFAAEDVDCGHRRFQWVCNLSAGHEGRHQVLEYVEEIDRTVEIVSWPNLKVSQPCSTMSTTPAS